MLYDIVPDFIIQSTSADLYLTYHLALLTQQKNTFAVSTDDSRFVDTGPIDVRLHYGPVIAIEYNCQSGNRYRMPRIQFAENLQWRQNNDAPIESNSIGDTSQMSQ